MPKPRGAGDLRQRVKFQARGVVDDGHGNEEDAWADLDPPLARWCSLTATRGGEAVQAARLSGKAMFDLWVRWDRAVLALGANVRAVEQIPGPDGAWVDGRALNVRFGPEDMDGDRKWLLLQVESGTAES